MFLSSSITKAEIYDGQYSIFEPQLDFIDPPLATVPAAKEFALFQNEPNPFSKGTMIRFEIPLDGEVHLFLTNNAGDLILEKSGYFTAGSNLFQLERSELSSSGIYYYRLEWEGNSATKKLVLIE